MNLVNYLKNRLIRKWQLISGYNLVNYKIESLQYFEDIFFRSGFIFNDYNNYVVKIELKRKIYVLFFLILEMIII